MPADLALVDVRIRTLDPQRPFASALAVKDGVIVAVGDTDDFGGLTAAIRADADAVTGAPVFTLPVALSLLVFFVFALQCTSTIIVMARETGSWRWPALAFGYMLGLAWTGSFVTFHVARAFVG